MKLLALCATLLCVVTVTLGVTSVSITNYVNVGGTRFATLDNVVPATTTSGCQSSPLLLPTGWTLATSNTNSMLAMMSFRWATTCLILADGTSYSVGSGASCGASQLAGSAVLGYNAVGCDRRILITQAGQTGDVDVTIGPAITNTIVVNGQVYATLDNAVPTDKSIGCQSIMTRLPTGWSIATDVDNSHILMLGNMYQFGTACLVLANGNSYSVNSGASCGTLNLQKYASIYYAPTGCDRRVLITRAALSSEPNTWSLTATISNFAVAQGYAFAVMDNTAPSDYNIGCQNRAYAIPTGWTIAKSSAAVSSVVTSNVFGTTCLVLADGTSLYHDGTPCSGGVNQLVTYKTWYAVAGCDRRVLITRAASSSLTVRPAVARVLGMKMLLISQTGDASLEGQLGVMRQAMVSMSIPYDEYAVFPNENAPAGILTGTFALRNPTATTLTGNYIGFVGTTDYTIHGLQPECLSSTNLADLNLYLQQFGARMVVLYTYPNGRGVTVNPTYASGGADPRTLRLNAGYASKATSLPSTFNLQLTGIWAYPATVTDASIATSVVEFANPDNSLQGCAGAIFNQFDGREEMHFFMDQATWSLHSSALISLWAPWVTRNMYIGSRRVVLSPQIDDLLLSTRVWDPTQNCSCGTPSRATPSDLTFLASFATSINTANKGSSFMYGFGFNGNGVNDYGGTSADALYKWVKSNPNAFNYESHTYTHRDLDMNDDDGTALHNTTYSEALSEMTLNQAFGSAMLGTNAHYDTVSLISPAITGMFNGNALKAIWDAGLRYLVGDNSRPELCPTNKYYGLYTTASFNGFGGLFIVPRVPTDIYYDCSTEAQAVNEYSYHYLAYWGYQRTLDQIMQGDAARAVTNLLAFRHDPYMFHQANTVVGSFWDPTTKSKTSHSLMTLWTRYVMMNLRKVNSLPIISKDHKTLATDLLARMALDACGVQGQMAMDTTGRITAYTVKSVGACTVGVTGFSTSVSGGKVETYGPDTTSWLPMTAGQSRTLTLSTPIQYY